MKTLGSVDILDVVYNCRLRVLGEYKSICGCQSQMTDVSDRYVVLNTINSRRRFEREQTVTI